MKHLSYLTIKEYNEFNELIKQKETDWVELFKLFGLQIDKMTIRDVEKSKSEILNMELLPIKIQKVYNINGWRFKVEENITKIKAGQYIDLQYYLVENRTEQILSIFLYPQEKKWFGYKTKKYGSYDMEEVQDYLLNNMTINDALELTNFFFQQSISLLKITQQSLEKKSKMKYLQNLKKMVVK